MNVEYAPVALFVYNRYDLLPNVLESLERNKYVEESELYIFSDGPKNEIDCERVEKVRNIIRSFSKTSSFKNVFIKEKPVNTGLAESIIHGVSELMDKYGKIIVVEDDLILSRDFLRFMNDSLLFYENNKRVWSIGGCTYGLSALEKYRYDVYACWRGESWGWASWKDRWDKVKWYEKKYSNIKNNIINWFRFCRGGSDLPRSLYYTEKGKDDSWAVRWCFEESMEDAYTILPRRSLVYNMGLINGTHRNNSENPFNIEITDEFEYVLENVEPDKGIMEEFREYFEHSSLHLYSSIKAWIYSRVYRR